jgi:hypothetical protein
MWEPRGEERGLAQTLVVEGNPTDGGRRHPLAAPNSGGRGGASPVVLMPVEEGVGDGWRCRLVSARRRPKQSWMQQRLRAWIISAWKPTRALLLA